MNIVGPLLVAPIVIFPVLYLMAVAIKSVLDVLR